MEGTAVLEKELIKGLNNSGTRLKDLRIENLTHYLGGIVGIDNLRVINDTAIHTSREKEFHDLLKVFEAGGRWRVDMAKGAWKEYECNTCLWDTGGTLIYSNSRKFYSESGFNIITPDEFYGIQNISSKQVEQIVALHDCVKGLLSK